MATNLKLNSDQLSYSLFAASELNPQELLDQGARGGLNRTHTANALRSFLGAFLKSFIAASAEAIRIRTSDLANVLVGS